MQGGAVARALLKTGKWKVRGITRNPSSKSAQALADMGAEMVSADLSDEGSLIRAFAGVYAVYGVTNFWEHLLSGKVSPDEAGELEVEQAKNIARACARTQSLEQYVFSTLQPATMISKGKRPVPHMDHKSRVDEWIKNELPGLGPKTTFMWIGFYPANLAFFPLIKPFELPMSGGKYVWMQPSAPDALLPNSGDVGNNVGVYVAAALSHPEKARGKYMNVTTDVISFREILRIWCDVSGRQAEYVECPDKEFEALWGVAGREMAMQYRFGQENSDWEVLKKGTGELVSASDLEIKRDQLIDVRGTFEALHAKGLL